MSLKWQERKIVLKIGKACGNIKNTDIKEKAKSKMREVKEKMKTIIC